MSQFSDAAKNIIGTVAPILGTALGGPLGALAGGLIAKALGKDGAPATPQDIEKALGVQDPATLLALKQAENDLIKHMADLGVQEQQLAYADTDSARKREETVKDFTPSILAYSITVGFFVLIYWLMHIDVPADNKAIVYSLVGSLGSTWGLAMGYYFGSSRSSSQKTQGLLDAINKK